MKYIKYFEEKEIDWEDFDDEEESENIFDEDMLRYLCIVTGNSNISSSLPVREMKGHDFYNDVNSLYHVYKNIYSLLDKLTIDKVDFSSVEIDWLNNINRLCNFRNINECRFEYNTSISIDDNIKRLHRVSSYITYENFRELYWKYFIENQVLLI